MAEGTTTNNMMFTIEAVPQSSNPISFDWTTAADTSGTNPATAGSDFSTTMRTGVTITANTPSVTINVPIIGDSISEYDETFVVNLSNAAGATLLNSQATGTIANDDGTTVSIAPIYTSRRCRYRSKCDAVCRNRDTSNIDWIFRKLGNLCWNWISSCNEEC